LVIDVPEASEDRVYLLEIAFAISSFVHVIMVKLTDFIHLKIFLVVLVKLFLSGWDVVVLRRVYRVRVKMTP
jgi:hypothetical protein